MNDIIIVMPPGSDVLLPAVKAANGLLVMRIQRDENVYLRLADTWKSLRLLADLQGSATRPLRDAPCRQPTGDDPSPAIPAFVLVRFGCDAHQRHPHAGACRKGMTPGRAAFNLALLSAEYLNERLHYDAAWRRPEPALREGVRPPRPIDTWPRANGSDSAQKAATPLC